MTNSNSNHAERVAKYVYAAIHLYGVIKERDLISIYQYYEKEVLTKEELNLILEDIPNADFSLFHKQAILSNGYFNLDEDYFMQKAKQLLAVQSKKERYLPSKEEFLKYFDVEYVEPMEPLFSLEKYIFDNKLAKNNQPQDLRYDVLELHDQIVSGSKPSHYLDYISRRGYKFKTSHDFNLFFLKMGDVINNTRMYENNGFTNNELSKPRTVG